MRRRRFLVGLAASAAVAVGTRRTAGADPALAGAWGPRRRLPHIAIHSVGLPGTTEVFHLAIKGAHAGPGALAWTLDPATGLVRDASIPFAYDSMCGGGVLDDDGRLRMYGGIISADRSATFDPGLRTWTWGPYMSRKQGAYYASAVRTGPIAHYPGGAIVVAFGRRSWMDAYDAEQYGIAELPRMADAVNIVALAGASTQYPRLLPLPDGRLILAGTQAEMYTLDVSVPRWEALATMRWGRRYEGCATAIGASGYEFHLCGAGDPTPARTRCEIVDARTGVVRESAPMAIMRKQHNTVLLPDGTVLILGGWTQDLRPECYDPVADRVTVLAPPLPLGPPPDQGPCVRGYHSTAELLLDGRVLWAGGTTGTKGFSYELFSPPYLFRGSRPLLTLAGDRVAHGGLLTLVTGDAARIDRVTLLRAEHSSHGYNAGQRCYDLAFQKAGGVVIATAPASPMNAPPGWYKLFALAAGVPSLGQWVRVA